ncbi:hypothetical protein BJX76DRAFT_92008 [Aspergillus varians]
MRCDAVQCESMCGCVCCKASPAFWVGVLNRPMWWFNQAINGYLCYLWFAVLRDCSRRNYVAGFFFFFFCFLFALRSVSSWVQVRCLTLETRSTSTEITDRLDSSGNSNTVSSVLTPTTMNSIARDSSSVSAPRLIQSTNL